jgi:hypothetical protein
MGWYCLRCDTKLRVKRLARKRTKQHHVIVCRNCQARYQQTSMLEADPRIWEKIRRDKESRVYWHESAPEIIRVRGGYGLNPKLEKLKSEQLAEWEARDAASNRG